MENIKAIINGNLQPWQPKTNLSDDYYSPELRKLHSIQEAFTDHYNIDFGIVPFSKKIKYYQKLIDIDIVKYLNKVLNETIGGSENLAAFKFDKAQRKIRSLLIEINELIERKQFDIALIASKYADFKTDHHHKECTFIFHYMLVAAVRCLLEIQAQFIEIIHNEDILTIEDIYSQILQKTAPDRPQIVKIQTITMPSLPLKKPKEKADFLSFKYKKIQSNISNITDLLDYLKKNGYVAQGTSITDFRHVFSGEYVANPIRWSGGKSCLSYFIKLLHNSLKVITYPGDSLWKVVCACFVDDDGSQFDELNLKDQKKPKLKQMEIERAANLLK
jgi:hypothetical protein